MNTWKIVSSFLGLLLRGFVVSVLWKWFVVPLGLPAISVPHGIGLSTLILFMTNDYTYSEELDSSDRNAIIMNTFLIPFGVPLLFLLNGWIIHFFM